MSFVERDPADAETMELIDSVERLGRLGVPVSVDPDIAETMGAFREEALSEEDALDALFDPEEIEPERSEELDGEETDHV